MLLSELDDALEQMGVYVVGEIPWILLLLSPQRPLVCHAYPPMPHILLMLRYLRKVSGDCP